MRFLLYHHKNRQLAEYIQSYSQIDKLAKAGTAQVEIASLPQQNTHAAFASLPVQLRELLQFAKPDLVIVFDDGVRPLRPVFAIEVTNHVPARDHWLQRFPNLVGPAQVGVPSVFMMPFHLPHYKSFNKPLDAAFFYGYERVMEIHQAPVYLAEWTSTDGKNLDADKAFPELPPATSTPMRNAMRFLDAVVDATLHGRAFDELLRTRMFVDLRDEVRKRAYAAPPSIKDFRRLSYHMPDDRLLNRQELEHWLGQQHGSLTFEDLPDRIKKRDRALIFRPVIDARGKTPEQLRQAVKDRIKRRGGDPYTGQPLAYDYLFCRLGPSAYERDATVVIDLSMLRFEDLAGYHRQVWKKCPLRHEQMKDLRNDHIPRYTMYLTSGCAQVMKNFLRVYAFTADIIVFSDGIVYF